MKEDSGPVHWTYNKFTADCDLQQGDIIESTDTIRSLCEQVHPYFCDQKFLGFMVITQSCDLVRRRGNDCSAHYINLAIIRSLEEVLPTLLNSVCTPLASCIYKNESKGEAKKLLSRVFNQNEQALGIFYLHPDEQAGIAVPSVVLLRVSVSFRSEHYKTITDARRGRLKPEFQSKLGWLTGNLFSRVGTTDWNESSERQKELKKLIALLMGEDKSQQSDNSIVWINGSWVEAAKKSGVNIRELRKDQLPEIIAKHKFPTPKEDIVKVVKQTIKKMLPNTDDEIIKKLENRLLNDSEITAALKRARLEVS